MNNPGFSALEELSHTNSFNFNLIEIRMRNKNVLIKCKQYKKIVLCTNNTKLSNSFMSYLSVKNLVKEIRVAKRSYVWNLNNLKVKKSVTILLVGKCRIVFRMVFIGGLSRVKFHCFLVSCFAVAILSFLYYSRHQKPDVWGRTWKKNFFNVVSKTRLVIFCSFQTCLSNSIW